MPNELDHMGLALTSIDLAEGKAPSEILLVPAGSVETRPHDSREAWSNTTPDMVVEATRDLRTDLVIDYEHQTEFSKQNGLPAPAAGWITEVFNRGGAIWGRVNWTDRARAHLESREYRYISPSFLFDRATRRVTRIVGAGLTNNPALFMKAIASATHEEPENMEPKALAAALGLPETATEAEILAAATAQREALAKAAEAAGLDDKADAAALITTIKEPAKVSGSVSAVAESLGLASTAVADDIKAKAEELAAAAADAGNPDPSKFAPISEVKALAKRVDELQNSGAEEKATATVDQAIKDGKVTPASRDWALAYAKKDADGFDQYLGKAPKIVGDQVIRGEPADGKATLSADQKALCATLGVTEEAYVKSLETQETAQ